MVTMTTGEKPSVAISGAGLSGLCLAQSLLREGFDVQVYERDSSPLARRQGYRLTVDDIGADTLEKCLPPHLFEAVLDTASATGDVGYFRFTNEHLGGVFTRTFKRDPNFRGPRMLGQVDRATLRTIMLSGLEDRVHFQKEATGFESSEDGINLLFRDGTAAFASLVVGADGIHSALRRQTLPDYPVIDTGFRGIYGKTPLVNDGKLLVPKALENSGVMASSGPGRIFFFTTMRFTKPPQSVFSRLVPDQQAPISDDYLMWAVVLPEARLPPNLLSLSAGELHELALSAAREYHPVLQDFVRLADQSYTVATEISTSTQPKDWRPSKVTLMGDAVHVMPPTGAHGGNTALRDAATLSTVLKEAFDRKIPLEQAVRTYQERMVAYAFKEVNDATSMLRRGNIKNPIARWFMFRLLPWMHPFRNSTE